jgi:hypothetical protein
MKERSNKVGFVEHELLMALVVLVVLGCVGIGVSKLLALHGRQALIPPGVTVGLFFAYVITLNVIEIVRDRRNK